MQSALPADALPSASPDEEANEDIARLAKALAHPARIRILRLLRARKTCVGGDIVGEVGLAQSTVSEHLRILKAAGIITGEIAHPRVCYLLNPERVLPLAEFVTGLAASEPQSDICTPA